MFAGRSVKHRLPSLTRTYQEIYRKAQLVSSKMGYLARLVLTFTFSLSPCGPGWGKTGPETAQSPVKHSQ